MKALLAQNAWNNAHGLSHKNRYVIGDLDWITVNNGAINKLLVAYNQNPNQAYRYHAVKLYLYLGGMQGFKVVKPDKNETLAQMMARLKKRRDRHLYGYEQYKIALKRESALLLLKMPGITCSQAYQPTWMCTHPTLPKPKMKP